MFYHNNNNMHFFSGSSIFESLSSGAKKDPIPFGLNYKEQFPSSDLAGGRAQMKASQTNTLQGTDSAYDFDVEL